METCESNKSLMFQHLVHHDQFRKEFALRLTASGRHTGIRVNFNWVRFLAERWPIDLVLLQVQSEFRKCVLPWYFDVNGHEVKYDSIGAEPLNLMDLPKSFHSLTIDHQDGIKAKEAEFQAVRNPICFAVPAYALPCGGYI